MGTQAGLPAVCPPPVDGRGALRCAALHFLPTLEGRLVAYLVGNPWCRPESKVDVEIDCSPVTLRNRARHFTHWYGDWTDLQRFSTRARAGDEVKWVGVGSDDVDDGVTSARRPASQPGAGGAEQGESNRQRTDAATPGVHTRPSTGGSDSAEISATGMARARILPRELESRASKGEEEAGR